MARYIDADKALKFIKKTNANYHWLLSQYSASWIYDFIESQPTADVVPKSEYDQLQKKYDLAVAEREANVKGFTEQIKTMRTDVARDVFWEIDKLLTIIYTDDDDGSKFIGVDMEKYYELKKKYKGESDDPENQSKADQ